VTRFLLLVLLLIVPLQITYAVAAGYCSHDEQGARASHLGHHAHKHAQSNADNNLPQGEVDLDCNLCQLGCAHVTFGASPQLAVVDSIRVAPHPLGPLGSVVLLAYTPPPLAAYLA
jgi:hypothetical protein